MRNRELFASKPFNWAFDTNLHPITEVRVALKELGLNSDASQDDIEETRTALVTNTLDPEMKSKINHAATVLRNVKGNGMTDEEIEAARKAKIEAIPDDDPTKKLRINDAARFIQKELKSKRYAPGSAPSIDSIPKPKPKAVSSLKKQAEIVKPAPQKVELTLQQRPPAIAVNVPSIDDDDDEMKSKEKVKKKKKKDGEKVKQVEENDDDDDDDSGGIGVGNGLNQLLLLLLLIFILHIY